MNYINNKRRYLTGAALVVGVLTLAGCRKNLLDTKSYTSVSSSTMWTTDNLTDLGVNGVYAQLKMGYSNGGASGREIYQYSRFIDGQGRDGDAFQTGTATPSNTMFSLSWVDFYEGVFRANDAIYNLQKVSPSAADKKSRYLAEMKFMRAYYYFRLNQVFKGVPIYLDPRNINDLMRPRNTEDEVWAQIIKDLTEAIAEPNLPAKYAKGSSSFGHATKGAAYALRGKVYMYQKVWDKAAADFQSVKDAGYGLFPTYRELFLEANEQSDECIFSIQNLPVDGFGSTTQFYCGTRSSFGSCWNTYLIAPDLVDAYENKDGSKFNWDAVIPGYSSKTAAQREVYFLRNNLTAAEITAATNRGAYMADYLPTGNEQRIQAVYANRDPRLTANVITPYATYVGRNINGADQTFTLRWPVRDELPPTLDLLTDTKSLFYYLHRKFVYTGSTQLPNRYSGGIDMPLIRYADVLLMWAEALNEQGNTAAAVDLVNQVRGRAGVGLLNSSAGTTVAGQDDLRKRIRHERLCEFPNEGISYFDELRWKTWKDDVFYPGNGIKQIWGTVVVPFVWLGDQLYTWAIPLTERQNNPKLDQNKGWIE
ncbi:RagB/SusD family nutrient uptake outer membrane protein [Chitinophaga sp. Cy-1792]|uniref:RagB/SusD family nutrient uptake outer membrane protein n=1 Tax=Chitinophaga sp. Cy-1792 TaxID=2608339 RepID=UPI0014244C9B|nr:RagB/SusD family nutrient uptake outer membrane protein [Chitinophaga sp. Cy-1792]NIG53364.1 RagB/SusD family nutrient uptake outer membrane protein [Chitinophaga sp. Cy-1792]